MATFTFSPTATVPSGYNVRNSYSGEVQSAAGRRYSFANYDGGVGTDTLNGSSLGDLVIFKSSAPYYGIEIGTVSGIEIFNLNGGNDILDLTPAPGNIGYGVAVTVNGGSGNDVIFAGNLGDRLNGDADADYINGNPGDDTIDGGAGADRLRGGADADTIFGDTIGTLSGAGANDTLYGDAGDDVLIGDGETLGATGVGGNDTLFGGAGDDVLHGDSRNALNASVCGNDILNGGPGDDVLFGDEGLSVGADRFVFAPGSGNDFIANFDVSVDRIDLKAYGFASTVGLFSDAGGVTTVTLSGADSITISADGLTAANFILV